VPKSWWVAVFLEAKLSTVYGDKNTQGVSEAKHVVHSLKINIQKWSSRLRLFNLRMQSAREREQAV
jgi:hypothetical protein